MRTIGFNYGVGCVERAEVSALGRETLPAMTHQELALMLLLVRRRRRNSRLQLAAISPPA